jgi:hypothetical protein
MRMLWDDDDPIVRLNARVANALHHAHRCLAVANDYETAAPVK